MSVLHNPPAAPKAATAVQLLKSGSSIEKLVAAVETVAAAEELIKMQEEFSGLSENEKRKAVMLKVRGIKKELRKKEQNIAESREKLGQLNLSSRISKELTSWLDGSDRPMKLQKPTPGATHALHDAILNRLAFDYTIGVDEFTKPEWREDFDKEIFSIAQTFVVEHDWAAAFSKASNMLSAQINLPCEVCCFEFRISDRRIVAIAVQAGESIHINIAIEAREGWGIIPGGVKTISDQITAICIALDAEIAYTEVVRAPHLRNSHPPSPQKSDYHVVSLSRRSLARPLPAPDGAAHGGRRLHFRRGHWRHLEKHKVWVKWCLVGDPDLGFVDKHYRL